MAGCRERDLTVFRMLAERGIPCAVSMGGGYSPDVKVIVEAHCQTYRAARGVYGI
jgi:acetoin utilization deacetylase AcuC-like enzyme